MTFRLELLTRLLNAAARLDEDRLLDLLLHARALDNEQELLHMTGTDRPTYDP